MIFFKDMAINLFCISIIRKWDGVDKDNNFKYSIIFIGGSGQAVSDITYDDERVRDDDYKELMKIVEESAIHKALIPTLDKGE